MILFVDLYLNIKAENAFSVNVYKQSLIYHCRPKYVEETTSINPLCVNVKTEVLHAPLVM
jgi:hypothetical protein